MKETTLEGIEIILARSKESTAVLFSVSLLLVGALFGNGEYDDSLIVVTPDHGHVSCVVLSSEGRGLLIYRRV